MTEPPDVRAAWRAHLLAGLAEHIASSVGGLLPEGDEVIAAGTHLVLTRRSGSGPPKTVVTKEITPVHRADPLELTAERMLDDLQDMIIGTLHRPWPESTGAGLHPWARANGDHVELAFADRDGRTRVGLPSFPVPPEPERVVTAG